LNIDRLFPRVPYFQLELHLVTTGPNFMADFHTGLNVGSQPQ